MQPFRMILAFAVTGIIFWSPGVTHAQTNNAPVAQGEIYHVLSARNELTLTEKFSRVIELDNFIARVDGFDPGILTVTTILKNPKQVRIQANTAGVTTLVLVDEHDKTYSIEVFVEGDVRHLQAYIIRFFPDSSVTAVKVKDSVVLRGVVADPSHISQITEIAEEFFPKVINQMNFGAATQVRLQVKIMEAQRSKIRQLGYNWSLLTNNGYISSNPGSLATPLGVTLNSGGGNLLEYGANGLADSSINFGVVSGSSIFRGFLEALKQEGLLRVLVETSIVADSGRPASLLSGGEFPILVPQALGTLSVEWREFGVKLEAVPIVLGQGQILLEIAPEFSERDFANAATLNNTIIPAITTRRSNTQVRMRMGQTLMIGGLIATRYTAETSKIPILGDLPIIGAAFRRVRYDENETELIILVTPEYAAPLDPNQVPEGGPGMFSDVPTDRELFMQGLIEVPKYGGPIPPMEVYSNGPVHHSGPAIPRAPERMPPQIQHLPPQPQPNSQSRYIPLESTQIQNTQSKNLNSSEVIPRLPAPEKAKGLQSLPEPFPVLPVPPVKTSNTQINTDNKIATLKGWHQQTKKPIPPLPSLGKPVGSLKNRTPSKFSWADQKDTEGGEPPSLILPIDFKKEVITKP
ncbi:MAG: pilus assembly protein N-terminal domain-containing protein [Planctomycetaceae bacterium]|nr:pilus assembly protein N-terminal domain-containing protein [Planctomycetaceae bacterium]